MKKGTSTKKVKAVSNANFVEPKFVGKADYQAPNTRRNRAATIDPTDKYIHLEGGINPFYSNNLMIDIQRTIQLCQQAYWNVAIVRNTIEIMVELCDSRVYLEGGNETSRNFIESWLKKINLESLKEQFFREYHRSGNMFLYRFDAAFNANDAKTLSDIFGATSETLEKLPIRYVFLNPARIRTNNTVIFQNSQFFQMITPVEMQQLLYPKTTEQKALFNSLDAETKKKIKNNTIPYIPLDQEYLYPIFAKKQDYEPFAVPFVFPVLEQINAHIEMQRIDQAITRTLDRALLLITNGAKPEDGGVSPQTIMALQGLFQSESVARTLVADYTTTAEWIMPDLNKVLGETKYNELNRQINIGLNSLFFNDNEKFANTSVKTQIFIERLEAPRKKFLTFIQDEVNRVCDLMNFKQYPQVCLEGIQLKDEAEFVRLFTRMTELGILTPIQFFKAIDSGKLPDVNSDDYMDEMKEYQKQRTDGLFLPLVGASMQDPNGQPIPGSGGPSKVPGRPNGSKAPQTTKKISPIGASTSMVSLAQNAELGQRLLNEVQAKTKKTYKIKELTDNQKHVCELVAQSIMLNEEKLLWNKFVDAYLKTMKSPSEEKLQEVDAIATEHNTSSYHATLLYLSKI